MTHLRLLIAAMLLFITGCSNDNIEVRFSLDSYDVTIPAEGGMVDVTVISNCSWELTGYTSWCEPSTKSGRGSITGEVISFVAERADKDRSITYRFNAGGEVFELRVSQQKVVALQPIDNDFLWILPSGGEATFEYETNMTCEVIIPEEAETWLSCDTRALTQRRAVVSATTNDTGISREASVMIRSTEVDNISISFTIHQPSTSNTILYTTTTGDIIEPKAGSLCVPIANNIIYDGMGIMEFTVPLIAIGDQAFYNLPIRSITLPDSLISIGNSSFSNCVNLSDIVLPPSLRTIEECAFQSCGSLPAITIPEGVTTIGPGAFRLCSSLAGVTMGDSVTSLGMLCFEGCEALEDVRLSDNITAIDKSTFYGCMSLRSLNIPSATSIIDCYAFCGCIMLDEATLPTGLTELGEFAFMSCHELSEIIVPEGVTSIGDNCFGDCTNLERVTLPTSLEELGDSAFFECLSLENITIPEGISRLDGTFTNCINLRNITLPESITIIGDYTFAGCASLTHFTAPTDVTHINQSAFEACTMLESMVLGKKIKQIQNRAFADCISLRRIDIDAVTPPNMLESNIIDGSNEACRIYVPAASLELYMNDSMWSTYADILEAL